MSLNLVNYAHYEEETLEGGKRVSYKGIINSASVPCGGGGSIEI